MKTEEPTQIGDADVANVESQKLKQLKQVDLEGGPPILHLEVTYESLVSVRHRYMGLCFTLTAKDDFLSEVMAAATAKARIGKVRTRLRPYPDVESIPEGARDRDARAIVAYIVQTADDR